MKTKTKTLQLKLTVEYNPGKVSTDNLKRLLLAIPNHACDEGLLTGETPATVKTWGAEVKELRLMKVRQHVMSNTDFPRCIHCGKDEDDAFVGGEECILREEEVLA